VADPPHSSRPVRPRRASAIDARSRREHEHAQAHPPGEAAPSLNSGLADNPARSTSRAMRREHKGRLVGFPLPSALTLERAQPDPEEAVRRQRVEAERLSRLAPGEWQLWIDGSAERLGVARATLEASVKSIIAQRDKQLRMERADALGADERERRRIAKAKTEAQREQDRRERRIDKESEQKLKEKHRVFAALIKLPSEQHQIRLVALAKSLDEDVAIIIDEFAAFVAANVAMWDPSQVEPWHKQVDTQALLLELITQIQRYVVLPNDAAIAVALWTMMAWVHTVATHSPNLMVTSTEPESGKSTLLAVLGLLTPRPFCTVEVTGPGLCHIVDRYHPTLIIDEGDNLFHRKTDLLHIVNTGWSRGPRIPRLMHGVLHQFDPFCPKIIGLKGMKMPDNLASRGVVIKLWPKTPDEKVSDFGFTDDDEFSTLRRKLVRWSADNAAVLKDLRPLLPAGFGNRLAANWRLLLAIADHAGGSCPNRARQAAVRLSRRAYKPSEGIRLLEALRAIFATRETITSADLVQQLLTEPDDEWGGFRGRTPITQRIIAALLAEYGIRPVVLHPSKRASLSARGYRRSQFADAFARFLPRDPNI
jgi:hypothetical protein